MFIISVKLRVVLMRFRPGASAQMASHELGKLTIRRSLLLDESQYRLIEYFVSGATARTAAALVDVHRNSAALYFHRLRQLICQAIDDDSPFAGEIEVDESYFGGARKGKRGRGAAGKVPVYSPRSAE